MSFSTLLEALSSLDELFSLPAFLPTALSLESYYQKRKVLVLQKSFQILFAREDFIFHLHQSQSVQIPTKNLDGFLTSGVAKQGLG